MCLVGHLTQSSERTGIENNWFALTGRVVAVKVEMDGDLHLALQDATGDKAGIVVCEIRIAASNAKPKRVELSIFVSGDWYDDEEEMLSRGIGVRVQ